MSPEMASQKNKAFGYHFHLKWIPFHCGQLKHLHQKGLFNPFSIDRQDNKNWKNAVLSQKLPRFDSHSPGEESLGEKETEGHLPPTTANVNN